MVAEPGTVKVTVPYAWLLARVVDSTAILGWGEAHHGMVSFQAAVEGTIMEYVPDLSFWSVGVDSVTFRYERTDGKPREETLVLIAGGLGGVALDSGFEQEFGEEGLTPQGATGWLGRVPEAAIQGQLGLSVASGLEDAWVEADLASEALDFGTPTLGQGQQGSKTQVGICPPGANVNDGNLAEGEEVVILAGGAGTNTAWVLRLRAAFGGGYEILASYNNGGAWQDVGPWYPLAGVAQQVEVDWWRVTADDSRGLQLRVDGEAVGSVLEPPSAPGYLGWVKAGRWGAPLHAAPSIHMDGLKVSYGYYVQEWAPLRIEDFQAGNLDRWSSTTLGPANLIAAPEAGDETTASIVLAVDISTPGFLTAFDIVDDRLGLRFRIDAREAQIPVNEKVLLFDGREATNERHIVAWLKKDPDGTLGVYAGARSSPDDVWHYTNRLPISSTGWTTVELLWRRSFDAAQTGRLDLLIDGVKATAEIGLATADRILTKYFVGARVVPTGATGKLYFDDIAAWVPATP